MAFANAWGTVVVQNLNISVFSEFLTSRVLFLVHA
jgi:hypothetical protein